MLDEVGESRLPIRVTPILPVWEEDKDEGEDKDGVEVAGEWTLTHHPPLLATLLLSYSWRGHLERTSRTLDTSWTLDTRWRLQRRSRTSRTRG
jgi:hypothetical protein